jgi:hypothetical protein
MATEHGDTDRKKAALGKLVEKEKAPGPSDATAGSACPVCGFVGEPNPRRESNGIMGPGGASWIIGYECPNCTVQFRDVKFFRQNVPAMASADEKTPTTESNV